MSRALRSEIKQDYQLHQESGSPSPFRANDKKLRLSLQYAQNAVMLNQTADGYLNLAEAYKYIYDATYAVNMKKRLTQKLESSEISLIKNKEKFLEQNIEN